MMSDWKRVNIDGLPKHLNSVLLRKNGGTPQDATNQYRFIMGTGGRPNIWEAEGDHKDQLVDHDDLYFVGHVAYKPKESYCPGSVMVITDVVVEVDVVIRRDGDGWVTSIKGWPEVLSGEGSTLKESAQNAQDGLVTTIKSKLKHNEPVTMRIHELEGQ